MIVTTGDSTSPHMKERARHMADAFGHVYAERRKQSLTGLARKYGDDEFLIYTNNSVRYKQLGVTELTYHPSMAFVRAKRILSGEADTMIRASGAAQGDEVLDCTAGFAADALVFAVAVGAAGRVVAVESEPSLFALVHEGLQLYASDVAEVNEAMRRIELQRADHLQKLKSMPERSMDIVYFDPMFRDPVTHSSAFNPMRTMTNQEALTRQAIEEAMRVARKRVVMKELRRSPEFARLGFNRVVQTGSKLAYGVIDIADNSIV
ncbi:class I SAM-dependent methyltransferase [Paenibacillus apiarius]|uniref:class I SAM-dependent methyltransferase n=1 Tax=Paenibacillus apiarius TaxID=46240 RepID=UPI003B3BCB6B